MQTILHNCSGLDVHEDSVVVCILKTGNTSEDNNKEEVEKEIRVFETFPDDSQSGAKKAVIAVARKILVIVYHLLKNNDIYNEQKFELSREKQEAFRLKRISSEANKLGYSLLPHETTSLKELFQQYDNHGKNKAMNIYITY